MTVTSVRMRDLPYFLLSFEVGQKIFPAISYNKTAKFTNQVLKKVRSIFIQMFFKKCVFSVSGTNAFRIYNNKRMQLRRKQVAVEYSLIQQHSPYLSLLLSKVFLKLSGIVGLKFCNDQSFSLTKFFTFTIKEKPR